MPRQARQRSDTGIYHVIQRGIDRMAIFYDDDDRQMYLNFLKLHISGHFKIYCYCLMGNHVHLLVKSDTLSAEMHHFASLYAIRFNHKYDRYGYLFQNRFKSEAIENETYFLQCFRYILRNPVKAAICSKPSDYPWSSYRFYYTLTDGWVDTGFLDTFFHSKQDFEEFIALDTPERCLDIDQFSRPTDQEIKQIFTQKLNGKQWDDLSISEKKELLRKLKYETNTGLRQLARITRTGYNIIRRL